MNNFKGIMSVSPAAMDASMTSPSASFWPSVIVKDPAGVERNYDLVSRALANRIIYLNGPVDDASTASIELQLMHLTSQGSGVENPKADIDFYINSPGGSVTAGLKVYDLIQRLHLTKGIKVNTVVTGMAASMGSFLAMSGTGKRLMMPNSTNMCHQPLSGSKGQETEMRIAYQGVLQCRLMLTYAYVRHCGPSLKAKDPTLTEEQIFDFFWEETERDNFRNAHDSIHIYGMADEILSPEIGLDVPDSILNNPKYVGLRLR